MNWNWKTVWYQIYPCTKLSVFGIVNLTYPIQSHQLQQPRTYSCIHYKKASKQTSLHTQLHTKNLIFIIWVLIHHLYSWSIVTSKLGTFTICYYLKYWYKDGKSNFVIFGMFNLSSYALLRAGWFAFAICTQWKPNLNPFLSNRLTTELWWWAKIFLRWVLCYPKKVIGT